LVPSKHRVLLRQYTYPKPLTHKSFIERPFPKNRKDKRGYLNEVKNRDFIKKLCKYFTTTVEVPRIRRRKKEDKRKHIKNSVWEYDPIEYDYVSSDPLTDFADDVKEPDDDVI
jgi:hypothetical protein